MEGVEGNSGYILAAKKGELAEGKVFEALEELEKEGLIGKFGQTDKFSQEDLRGIDFIIITEKGKEIRLQVQSTFKEKAMKKYLKRGIFYIVPGKDKEEVKERILRIIKKAINR